MSSTPSTPRRGQIGSLGLMSPSPVSTPTKASVALPLSTLPAYSSASHSRLQSLYSDLSRQKHSNPSAFKSNVDWWRRTLEEILQRGWQRSKDTLILRVGPELKEALRYERVGRPLGLASVVTDLKSTRTLIPLSTFQSSTTSIYAHSDSGSIAAAFASNLIAKPLWWTLEQLNLVSSDAESHGSSSSSSDKEVGGPYVFVPLLEQAAEVVQERLAAEMYALSGGGSGVARRLYTFESFRQRIAGGKGTVFEEDVELSNEDVDVLVRYLARDKGVLAVDRARNVIKYVGENASGSECTVTPVDAGILELKSGVEALESQVEDIERRISERNAKVTESLRAERKTMALSYLKSRKLLEEVLGKRLGSLEILRSTLMQVETAAEDIEIMKQYESSTTTLRNILSHPSLQRDKIDETMDAMAEANSLAKEVDDAIRGGFEQGEEDEKELQDELEMLVKEVKGEEAEKERVKLESEQQKREQDVEVKLTELKVPSEALDEEREQDKGVEVSVV